MFMVFIFNKHRMEPRVEASLVDAYTFRILYVWRQKITWNILFHWILCWTVFLFCFNLITAQFWHQIENLVPNGFGNGFTISIFAPNWKLWLNWIASVEPTTIFIMLIPNGLAFDASIIIMPNRLTPIDFDFMEFGCQMIISVHLAF